MSWLQPTERDTDYFEQLQAAEHKQLHQYAQVLAMAARIDPHLLRSLRLQFLPNSPVELELALWFSDAISSRNATGADMYPGVARLLCDELRVDADRYEHVKGAVKSFTRHWRAAEQLEQTMRWAVLEDDVDTLQHSYQRILHQLQTTDGAFEKREIARWAKGALATTLDKEQPLQEATWLYQYVAAALGSSGQWLEKSAVKPLPDSLRMALPEGKPQKIGIRVYQGVLQFVKPDEGDLDVIEVNLPIPTNIQIRFDGGESRWETVWYGRTLRISSEVQSLELQTLNGYNFSIEIEQTNNNNRFVNTLDSRMTFANFVEGKSNQLARAASLKVGEDPGGSYNPLFLYGGVGLGKTHLMHAIGNRILEHNPQAQVLYISAERFVNDMITALRNSRIDEFKQHYRSVDALLVDNVQFFVGKERSMEEFFHTFNALMEGQKQIILASDRFLQAVEGIDDRLRSRFNWGLTVHVEPPDLETRVAILHKKAEDANLDMPQDVAFFIGKRIRSNIRDLENALQQVTANMRLRSTSELSVEFVNDALRDQLASQDKRVSITNIKKVVAQYYNIRVNEMDSKRLTRSVLRPRQIAMALAKELTSYSLSEIGSGFGNRKKTTVLNACRKVQELRDSDNRIEKDYRILTQVLTN